MLEPEGPDGPDQDVVALFASYWRTSGIDHFPLDCAIPFFDSSEAATPKVSHTNKITAAPSRNLLRGRVWMGLCQLTLATTRTAQRRARRKERGARRSVLELSAVLPSSFS